MKKTDYDKYIPAKEHLLDNDQYQDRIRKDESSAATEDATKVVDEFGLRTKVAGLLTSKSLQETQARKATLAWYQALSNDERPLLALLGPCGTGKTVAAAEIAYLHKSFRYIRSQKLTSMARVLFGAGAEAYEHILGVQTLLIVDEIGFERDRDGARQTIHEVIDHRKTFKRPTILISNLTAEEFAEAFDARTIDRMREYGALDEIKSDSLRGKE